MSIKGIFNLEDVWRWFINEESAARDPRKAEKRARERARVRLNQMVDLRKLVSPGRVQLHEWGTKRKRVFCSPEYATKADWVTHDCMLWVWLRTVPNARIVTGFDCDPEVRADADITFSNRKEAFAEMDNASESLARVVDRWDILATRTRKVLFISARLDRIAKLKERAARHAIGNRIFFAFWYDLVRTTEQVWEDCKGTMGQLYPAGG